MAAAASFRIRNSFEEESGKLRATTQAGLLINRHGMLTDCTLAPARCIRDLLVALAFEEMKRHFALDGRQAPLCKAVVYRFSEAG